MIDTTINLISWGVLIGAAGVFMIGALLLTYWLAGLVGTEVLRRLRRIYHLSVIVYWLNRLEKEGTHCFQKAEGK